MAQCAPHMVDIFRNGSSKMKSAKSKRVVQALKWKQSFQNTVYCDIQIGCNIVRMLQLENPEMSGVGTGGKVWPAAYALSKFMELAFPDQGLSGKRVCDVGSGTGVVGIVASFLGASTVLTDQQSVFALMERNKLICCQLDKEHSVDLASDNLTDFVDIQSRIEIKEYNWGENCDHLHAPFDFVIVSDCVLPQLYPIEALVQAMEAVMGEETICLISYEHRTYPLFDPREEFRRLCFKHKLVVVGVPIENHHPDYCSDEIEIWKVVRESYFNQLQKMPLTDDTSMMMKGLVGQIETGSGVELLGWGEQLPVIEGVLNGQRFQIKQHQSHDTGVGNILWTSSVILSRYILSELFGMTNLFAITKGHSTIAVELGAGCGLTSMALWSKGFHVISSDVLTILPILKENIDLFTGSSDKDMHNPRMSVVPFHWSSDAVSQMKSEVLCMRSDLATSTQSSTTEDGATAVVDKADREVDLIVCSDCLYASFSVAPLVDAINEMSGPHTVVLMANEMRCVLEDFYLAMRRKNWFIEYVDLESLDLSMLSKTACRDVNASVETAMSQIPSSQRSVQLAVLRR